MDWTDVEQSAKEMAGNWRKFESFAWHRSRDLEDADKWAIIYTSRRDSGLLDQSNAAEITERLAPFTEGDDPDVVFESHDHWAVGHIDGFSLRVYRADGTVTPAFEELCRIKAALEEYPVLNESDYSEREYDATLLNYRNELGRLGDPLPAGWEAEVYGWFSDHGDERFIENRDDQGAWAPREKIVEALQGLGLWPDVMAGSSGPCGCGRT